MHRTWISALIVVAGLALAGCTQPSGPEPLETGPTDEGSASVYVKDAPADDFAEIHVVFTAVEVHVAGGGNETDDDMDANETGDTTGNDTGNETGNATGNATGNETGDQSAGLEPGWHVIVDAPEGIDVDLLDASDDRAAFLGEADLEPGTYTQVRIVVSEAYGIDHNGERQDFRVPSGKVRFNTPFTVEPDQETRVVLDIDLERSLREQGPSGWMLHPVLGQSDVQVVDDGQSGAQVHGPGEVAVLDDEDGDDGAGNETDDNNETDAANETDAGNETEDEMTG